MALMAGIMLAEKKYPLSKCPASFFNYAKVSLKKEVTGAPASKKIYFAATLNAPHVGGVDSWRQIPDVRQLSFRFHLKLVQCVLKIVFLAIFCISLKINQPLYANSLLENQEILSLSDLTFLESKHLGFNGGGVYQHSTDIRLRWFIKKPELPAHTAYEYIAGKLLSLLGERCFATISLVADNPDHVASKFIEDFKSYRGYGVHDFGELANVAQRPIHGVELLAVAISWIGLMDDNTDNNGTVLSADGSLQLSRIDYDLAFNYGTFDSSKIDFRIQGLTGFDPQAFMDALIRVIRVSENQLNATLDEIFQNLDRVGVDFNDKKRTQLKSFLLDRQEQFKLRLREVQLSQSIIKHLENGQIIEARKLYQSSTQIIQEYLQREWLLENYVLTRNQYAEYLKHLPEILENSLHLTNNEGHTPLHHAAEWNDIPLLTLLLEKNNDPHLLNIRDERGWTPAHIAADWGFIEAFTLLVERGANPNIQTIDGKTPFDLLEKHEDAFLRESIVGGLNQVKNLAFFIETAEQWERAVDSLTEADAFKSKGIRALQNLVCALHYLSQQYRRTHPLEFSKRTLFLAHKRTGQLYAIRAHLALLEGSHIKAMYYANKAVTHRKTAVHLAKVLGRVRDAITEAEYAQWPANMIIEAQNYLDGYPSAVAPVSFE